MITTQRGYQANSQNDYHHGPDARYADKSETIIFSQNIRHKKGLFPDGERPFLSCFGQFLDQKFKPASGRIIFQRIKGAGLRFFCRTGQGGFFVKRVSVRQWRVNPGRCGRD